MDCVRWSAKYSSNAIHSSRCRHSSLDAADLCSTNERSLPTEHLRNHSSSTFVCCQRIPIDATSRSLDRAINRLRFTFRSVGQLDHRLPDRAISFRNSIRAVAVADGRSVLRCIRYQMANAKDFQLKRFMRFDSCARLVFTCPLVNGGGVDMPNTHVKVQVNGLRTTGDASHGVYVAAARVVGAPMQDCAVGMIPLAGVRLHGNHPGLRPPASGFRVYSIHVAGGFY